MAEKNNSLLAKTAIVGVVAGLIGGGVSYVGLDQLNNANLNSSAGQTSINSKQAEISKSAAKNSGSMTPAYNRVKGSVVSVINLKRQRANNGSQSLFGFGDSDSDSNSSKSGKLETYSEGSGVIYRKSDNRGYIVTNNHVVSGSDEIQVILANGRRVNAKIVGKDSVTDLAVLSIDSRYVSQTAQFGDSKSLVAGQSVIAVGSPMGSEYASTVTQGIVSAPSRTMSVTDSSGSSIGQQTVIQTDAAINPGNSGGALVNSAGQVIGINSMKLSQSTDGTSVEGMGFAIPSNEVVSIINQLVKNGKISRPQLGIKVLPVKELPSYYRKQLNVKTNSGVFVAQVVSSGPAAKAGIKRNDVITAVDGKKTNDVSSLHTILFQHHAGDTVNVTVNRAGAVHKISVKLGSN